MYVFKQINHAFKTKLTKKPCFNTLFYCNSSVMSNTHAISCLEFVELSFKGQCINYASVIVKGHSRPC